MLIWSVESQVPPRYISPSAPPRFTPPRLRSSKINFSSSTIFSHRELTWSEERLVQRSLTIFILTTPPASVSLFTPFKLRQPMLSSSRLTIFSFFNCASSSCLSWIMLLKILPALLARARDQGNALFGLQEFLCFIASSSR